LTLIGGCGGGGNFSPNTIKSTPSY
jgi:hypothetical protein